jgi:glutamyl-tRNA synthetase
VLDHDLLERATALAQERAVTLNDIVDAMGFLFVADGDFEIEADSWSRLEATDRVCEVLDATIAHVESCAWDVESIDLRPAIDALGMKARKAMPALYTAVEGRHQGLPLFDSILLLGRERTLARLRAARARLG